MGQRGNRPWAEAGLGLALLSWLGILLFSAGAAQAQAPKIPWPHIASDLPADPGVRFGALPNGMRYAIMANETPKQQVAMRLQIEAGSMQEGEGQKGLAHFIEHMAFRGSTHVPDGEVTRRLARLGLALGPDANASTSQTATTFAFNLARNDAESIDTGLLLLRETASEVTFDPQVAKLESGVVISEERSRAGAQFDVGVARSKLVFGEHPFGRPPIGDPAVIGAADVTAMRRFYDAYYRPERAVLVVVGDIDPAAMEAKIKASFSGWRGKGPAGSDPSPLNPAARGTEFVAVDGKPVVTQLGLTWIKPYRPALGNEAGAAMGLREQLAQMAFANRLATINEASGRPFAGAGGGVDLIPGVARIASLNAAMVTDWKATLDILVKARAQAMQFGLTQPELDRAKTSLRANLAAAATAAPTRRSTALADGLVASSTNGVVAQSPEARLALFDKLAARMTLAEVNASLAELLTGEGPLVFISLPGAPQGDQAAMRAAYDQAAGASVTQMVQAAAKPWTHVDFGPVGRVVERTEHPDLGMTVVRFANGVRMVVRPNTAAKDQIAVEVDFGHGSLDLPRNQPGAAGAVGAVLASGALSDLSQDDLGRTLNGRMVSASFSMGGSHFRFRGITRPTDMALQMQLLTARVVSPGWRDAQFERIRDAGIPVLGAMNTSPALVYGRESGGLLHSGDGRFITPSAEQMKAWTPAAARSLIEPILLRSDLQVYIAGDISVDAAIAETAKTFGALPIRPGAPEIPGARNVAFPGPTAAPVLLTHSGRPDQALAAMAWPSRDFVAAPREAMVGDVVAAVMRQRLVSQLRSAGGLTYAPMVQTDASAFYPGYGYLHVQAEVSPSSADEFYEKVAATAADLAANPVPPDELARALNPLVETQSQAMQSNTGWIGWMPYLLNVPNGADVVGQWAAGFKTINSQDLQTWAKARFVPAKAWRAKVVAAGPAQ